MWTIIRRRSAASCTLLAGAIRNLSAVPWSATRPRSIIGSAPAGSEIKKSAPAESVPVYSGRKRVPAGPDRAPDLGALCPDAAALPPLQPRQDLGYLGGDGKPPTRAAWSLLSLPFRLPQPPRSRCLPAAVTASPPRSPHAAVGRRLHPSQPSARRAFRSSSATSCRTLASL